MTLWNTTQKVRQINGKKAEHYQEEFVWDEPSPLRCRDYSNYGNLALTQPLKVHFLGLTSCCPWLLQGLTFLLCVLFEIWRGSSSLPCAVESASLTLPFAPRSHALVSVTSRVMSHLILHSWCPVTFQVEVSRCCPVFPGMWWRVKSRGGGWGRRYKCVWKELCLGPAGLFFLSGLCEN